jgi:hypothetical protein
VGCETIDRDHVIWDNYKDYLPPLGVKKIRLQAGWAKCEKEARIAGLAFASNSDKVYLGNFLDVIAEAGKLDLFDWITYHSYTMRPEDAYTENRVLDLRSVLEKYSQDILLRQGENGAPSTYIPSFALSEYYWTEYTQAKYNMRRPSTYYCTIHPL